MRVAGGCCGGLRSWLSCTFLFGFCVQEELQTDQSLVVLIVYSQTPTLLHLMLCAFGFSKLFSGVVFTLWRFRVFSRVGMVRVARKLRREHRGVWA